MVPVQAGPPIHLNPYILWPSSDGLTPSPPTMISLNRHVSDDEVPLHDNTAGDLDAPCLFIIVTSNSLWAQPWPAVRRARRTIITGGRKIKSGSHAVNQSQGGFPGLQNLQNDAVLASHSGPDGTRSITKSYIMIFHGVVLQWPYWNNRSSSGVSTHLFGLEADAV